LDVVSPSITLQVPVTVAAGAVSELEITLPACTTKAIFLPVILKPAGD
jgi:hypothetical protein